MAGQTYRGLLRWFPVLVCLSGCGEDANTPEGDGGMSDGGMADSGIADGGTAVDAGSSTSVWDELSGVSMTAVSSQIYSAMPASARADHGGSHLEDFYMAPSAPVCTDEWIDFGCDGDFPLYPPEDNCAGDLRIDFAEEAACPVCVDPPATEPTCDEVRRRYLEFLDHNLRETCTNWCETASDCVLWEVDACGLKIDFAFRGLVDEEPLAFADSFDIDNCHVCDGEPTHDQSIEGELQVLCENHQCVIQPAGDGS